MIEGVAVEMMGPDFLLWRCLHGGPLTKATVDQPPPPSAWEGLKARNVPLLKKLMATYGTCAVVARAGDEIVGQLRFYPKAICAIAASGPGLCLQAPFPAGPAEDLVQKPFPRLEEMGDKTLFVHCLMTGSPKQAQNPYQRKGLGKAMVRRLIEWAGPRGWQAVEATAYEDLEIIYAVTGQAGKAFWEKLGFRVVQVDVEPAFTEGSEFRDFVKTLRQQAEARGLAPTDVVNRYRMRLELV